MNKSTILVGKFIGALGKVMSPPRVFRCPPGFYGRNQAPLVDKSADWSAWKKGRQKKVSTQHIHLSTMYTYIKGIPTTPP